MLMAVTFFSRYAKLYPGLRCSVSASATACALHPLAHCYHTLSSVGPQAGNQPRWLLLLQLALLLWASGFSERTKNNALVKDLNHLNPNCRTVGREKLINMMFRRHARRKRVKCSRSSEWKIAIVSKWMLHTSMSIQQDVVKGAGNSFWFILINW